VLDARGSEAELEAGSGAHKEVADAIARMARTGLRTIGFAYQDYGHIDVDPLDPGKLVDPVEDPPMVFVGVVGIKDPLRPEARASVRECQRAGVIVRMVTGDMKETAEFIARECGIITSPKHVALTGDEFRVLVQNKEEAERVIPWLRVLARSLPEDKETLVRWLKEHGEVVAATGDGTNDAPALKEAHVGLAMNIVGTAVAKAAAKILILDDNFSSIVKSIMWGRCVYDNIRKFLQFQLTINVVALAITLIGAFSGYENPLRPVQLLWVNLIMDTLAALALGTEEPNNLLLRRRPYQRDARLISPIMWRNILGQAAFQLTALMFILFAGNDVFGIEKRGPEVDERDRNRELFTLVFNTFVWMQLFNEINSRKVNNEMNVFASFFTNYIFWLIMAVTVLMQVVMVQVLGDFADTTAQNGAEWGYA
jgi:calcium-translocating P-type ATPase